MSIFCIGYAKSDIKYKTDNNSNENWRQELEGQLNTYKIKLNNKDFEYEGEKKKLNMRLQCLNCS